MTSPAGSRARILSRAAGAAVLAAIGAAIGPVFQKEVRVSGRKTWTYVLRAGYVLLLLFVAAIAYASTTRGTAHLGGAAGLQQLQRIAPNILSTVAWVQWGALMFISPILTAPAICEERRSRTLPALMTTPLNAWQIVVGKVAGAMVQSLIIVALGVPVLLAIRVFGGLSAEAILAVTAISLSSAFLAACLGVMLSSWQARATAVIVTTYGVMAFAIIGPILIHGAASGFRGGVPPPGVLMTCTPFAMALNTIEGARVGLGVNARELWIGNVIYSVSLALVALIVASISLRRLMLSQAGGESVSMSLPAPTGSAAPAIPGSIRQASRERFVSDAPVLWRR